MPYNTGRFMGPAGGAPFDYSAAFQGAGRNGGAAWDAAQGIDHSKDFLRAFNETTGLQPDPMSAVGRDDGVGGVDDTNFITAFYGNGGGGKGFRKAMGIYGAATGAGAAAGGAGALAAL